MNTDFIKEIDSSESYNLMGERVSGKMNVRGGNLKFSNLVAADVDVIIFFSY